jgi:hypothetical protein
MKLEIIEANVSKMDDATSAAHFGYLYPRRPRNHRFTGSENPTDTPHPNNVATTITTTNIHHAQLSGMPRATNTANAPITTNICVK